MHTHEHEFVNSLHNKYQGEPLYVLATGPSLQKYGEDINLLKDKKTFGCNYLMRVPTIQFVPSFYGASEIDFLYYIDPLVRDFDIPKFINSLWATDIPGWTWVYMYYLRDMREGWFSGFGEKMDWTAMGHGVVFDSCVQMGVWMGFDPIYLLGVDATEHGHAYKDDDDPSDRKRKRSQTTVQCANIAFMIMASNGRKLVNVNDAGNLVIPRISFNDALANKANKPDYEAAFPPGEMFDDQAMVCDLVERVAKGQANPKLEANLRKAGLSVGGSTNGRNRSNNPYNIRVN